MFCSDNNIINQFSLEKFNSLQKMAESSHEFNDLKQSTEEI